AQARTPATATAASTSTSAEGVASVSGTPRTRKASPSRRGSGPGLSKGASPGRQPDQRPALPRSLRGAPVRAHGDPLRRERRGHLAGDGLPGLRRYPRLVIAVADSELK